MPIQYQASARVRAISPQRFGIACPATGGVVRPGQQGLFIRRPRADRAAQVRRLRFEMSPGRWGLIPLFSKEAQDPVHLRGARRNRIGRAQFLPALEARASLRDPGRRAVPARRSRGTVGARLARRRPAARAGRPVERLALARRRMRGELRVADASAWPNSPNGAARSSCATPGSTTGCTARSRKRLPICGLTPSTSWCARASCTTSIPAGRVARRLKLSAPLPPIPLHAQRLEVEHAQAAVFDADRALRLQRAQRLVDALARQADQVGQLLLRDAQQFAHAGKQHRVEQRRQVARHARVGVVQAVGLARRDELAQPLVELVHHEAVEADRVVEQPVESRRPAAPPPRCGAAPGCCSGRARA